MARIVLDGSLQGWRAHARALVASGASPEEVQWVDLLRGGSAGAGGLFAPPDPTPLPSEPGPELMVPRAFARHAGTAACHRSPEVWPLLYRLLHRIVAGERQLLDDPLDPDIAALTRLEKAVRRDAHKMHAFVRFRRVEDPSARGGERFVAWYQPSHLIVEREAGFFRERFPSMDWSILTPDRCAHWDGAAVRFTPGAPRDHAPDHDELEEMWCSYYASIFNPARVKLKAMAAEMPRKFWPTLPETAQLPRLLADVPRRLEEMARTSRRAADSAHPFVPQDGGLDRLRGALSGCEGCELHRNGTRPVPGEGSPDAKVVLLGEQPGDTEEREGRPFVGPAGALLRRLFTDAGLDERDLYLTNAVKHFRHEVQPSGSPPEGRGKRRIHKRPTTQHSSRCQPWLDAELQHIQPRVLVSLGTTALRSIHGPTARMPDPADTPAERPSRYAPATLSTFHPAAILRAVEEPRRQRMMGHLVATLTAAREAAGLVTGRSAGDSR